MAIQLSRQGGLMKFVEGSTIKYYNLNGIMTMIKGTTVSFMDGRWYDYTSFSSPVFASAEEVADQVGIWKAEAQAGSGGSSIVVVANYSALPDPTTVSGQFYFAENSQGTKWLPGSLGGTYYNAGIYYSNGISWKYTDTPYNASLSTVNAGVNDEQFLTPYTFANSDKIVNSFQKNVDDSDDITEGAVNKFDKNFVFNQAIASTSWSIVHNLGKFPSVTIVDSANTVVVGQIVNIDTNSLTLNFNAPFSGKAYLN